MFLIPLNINRLQKKERKKGEKKEITILKQSAERQKCSMKGSFKNKHFGSIIKYTEINYNHENIMTKDMKQSEGICQ